jgi:hypothetical protein
LTAIDQQLSLDVLPDSRIVPGGVFVGTLRVSGEFPVEEDLNRGQQLVISIADADGQVLATALAAVVGVGFVTLYEKETAIGTERQHKARLA